MGAGVDLRRPDPQDPFQSLGVRIDHGDAGQAEIGGAAIDDQVVGDGLAVLAEADDQGVDAFVADLPGDQERRVVDAQGARRHLGHRQHPGPRLVERGRRVLGQAHVAHQDGDEGVGRHRPRRLRQHQGLGVILLGQQDVVGIAGILADDVAVIVQRPWQGDRPDRLRAQRRRSQPDDALAGALGRLEGARGDAFVADDDHVLAHPARRGMGRPGLQQGEDGEKEGAGKGDEACPLGDAEPPIGRAGRSGVVKAVGVVEQAEGAEGGVGQPVALVVPGRDAQRQGNDCHDRNGPGRVQAEAPGSVRGLSAHARPDRAAIRLIARAPAVGCLGQPMMACFYNAPAVSEMSKLGRPRAPAA